MGVENKFTTPSFWCDKISPHCPFEQHGSCGVTLYLRKIQNWKTRRKQAKELFDSLPDNREDLVAICEKGLYHEVGLKHSI